MLGNYADAFGLGDLTGGAAEYNERPLPYDAPIVFPPGLLSTPQQPPPPPAAVEPLAASCSSSAASVDDDEPDPSEIDIQVRNVVCSFHVPCHVDLHRFTMASGNVFFDKHKGVVVKQKRNPPCYVRVYSSGKVTAIGCHSEEEARRAARGIARHVQRLVGSHVRLCNYRISNILATCRMPFGIRLEQLKAAQPQTELEPELGVGLIWRFKEPKATARIHTTGSITVTGATSSTNVLVVLQRIYPVVKQFRVRSTDGDAQSRRRAPRRRAAPPAGGVPKRRRLSGEAVDGLYSSYYDDNETTLRADGGRDNSDDDDDFEDV